MIFSTLMATRAARVAPEHVRALNMISMAFYGPSWFNGLLRGKANEEVLKRWREYERHLSPAPRIAPDDIPGNAAWRSKGDELFVNLLEAPAKRVGYRFDRESLKTGGYTPMHGWVIEEEQARIRKLLIGALDGSGGALAVKTAPVVDAPQIEPPGPARRWRRKETRWICRYCRAVSRR